MDLITALAQELGIKKEQAKAAVTLIDEGNTIPFIARYRKEATGALNDEVLRNLYDRLMYLRNLEEKKEQVLASINEQGKLTEALRAQILAAETMVVVDARHDCKRKRPRTACEFDSAADDGTFSGRRSGSFCKSGKRSSHGVGCVGRGE